MRCFLFSIIAFCLLLCSCSLFYPSCKKNVTDKNVVRASVEVFATDVRLAEEKAKIEAQKLIFVQIDEKIAEAISYKSFLSDADYENKLNALRTEILDNCEVSCSHIVKKTNKIMYSTTLQISQNKVNDIISTLK